MGNIFGPHVFDPIPLTLACLRTSIGCEILWMGDQTEFSWSIRAFLRAYPWRRIDPVPWTSLKKPLAQCRLALVSSAGFVLPDQAPFDESIKGGDPSFREIPSDVDVQELVDTHRSESFDHAGLQRDPNLAFPIDRV